MKVLGHMYIKIVNLKKMKQKKILSYLVVTEVINVQVYCLTKLL